MPKMSSAARRWSQVAFTILISLVLAVSFYTAVVVGQPTESEDSAATKAAWRTDETGNRPSGSEAEAFPTLRCAENNGWKLSDESWSTQRTDNGTVRILKCTWQTLRQTELTTVSVFPAEAREALLRQDDLLLGEGPAVAGCKTLRFGNGQSECLVFTKGENAYAVYTDDLEGITDELKWLQLSEVSTASPMAGGNE